MYFSIKYKLELTKSDTYKYAEDCNDCIVILLSFLYEKCKCKNMRSTPMIRYKKLAENLYANGQGMDANLVSIQPVGKQSVLVFSGYAGAGVCAGGEQHHSPANFDA